MPAALRTRLRPAIAPDEIVRPQRPAIAERDVDAGLVLHEARHLDAAIDRHLELLDPAARGCARYASATARACRDGGSESALMSNTTPANPGRLHLLPFGKEAVGDAALVEDLDGARMEAAGAVPDEVLAGPALDNGNVDARQRQLARQHQPRRAAAGNDHRMLGLSHSSPPQNLAWAGVLRRWPGS